MCASSIGVTVSKPRYPYVSTFTRQEEQSIWFRINHHTFFELHSVSCIPSKTCILSGDGRRGSHVSRWVARWSFFKSLLSINNTPMTFYFRIRQLHVGLASLRSNYKIWSVRQRDPDVVSSATQLCHSLMSALHPLADMVYGSGEWVLSLISP
jgi:hypothetical protein